MAGPDDPAQEFVGRREEPDFRPRDRDDARTLGRGPGSDRQASDDHGRDRRDDPRWADRDRGDRERDRQPRDLFTRHLHLPRGLERELVRYRDREYTLRGSESRTLATFGAFRVVSSRDLREHHDRPADPRSGDLRHLREQGLIETVRVPGYREHAVVLTKQGRSLLEMGGVEHKYVGPAMHDRIVGALETCCRRGEMLRIQNRHVDWERHQIAIPGRHAKDAENRRIPFDPQGRLAPVLERRASLGPNAYVFGSPAGEFVATSRRPGSR